MDNPVHPPGKSDNAIPTRWRFSAALVVVLALFTALYVARAVILPIVLALVLSFALAPMVVALQRLFIPRAAAAALVLITLIALLAGGVNLLAGPAQEWMERAPDLTTQLGQRLESVTRVLRQFSRATEKVEALAQSASPANEQAPVKVQGPGLRHFILSSTWEVAAGAAMLVFLLYFLLASGNSFLRRLVKVLPRFQEKRIAVTVVRRIRTDVTRYLLTVTAINIGLGVVTAAAMALLGMPNPALWGVMATVLNFVPYLGSTVTLAVIAAVALLTFDSLAEAITRPLTFLGIATLEGQLITPYILGQRLMLHPVIIFVCLIFWAWLWGIPGALLAVPLTMTIKIVCDAVPPLRPIGLLMGR
jgi:predicted PurR-regulated permease PerM